MSFFEMAMGQEPNRTPSEHPNPTTKIGSKMDGAPKPPQNGIPLVLTTTAICFAGPAKQAAINSGHCYGTSSQIRMC